MFVTSDIALSAYLMMKGVKLISAGRSSGGKFNFEFDDSQAACNQYSVDFLNSECSRFDGAMKKLKIILYKS